MSLATQSGIFGNHLDCADDVLVEDVEFLGGNPAFLRRFWSSISTRIISLASRPNHEPVEASSRHVVLQ